MTPVRLTNGQRELVALYHAPAAYAPEQRHAVLLCNPFGQEAIRAHRLYRVMADRLAAAGFAVLRFDYYGSGDSAGDDDAWDVEGSIGDAGVALDELLRRSHARHWSAAGLRLGASIALQTAGLAAQPATNLLLIDPVLDGPAYLAALAAANLEALNRAYGPRWTVCAPLRRAMLPRADDEALGFALSADCRRQIARISAAWLLPLPAPRVSLLVPDVAATRQRLARAGVEDAAGVRVADSQAHIDWATDSAAATAIVPMHWINHLLDLLGQPAYA